MKTKTFVAAIFLTATFAFAQTNRLITSPGAPVVLTATATNDLVSALQRGLFEEEGNRDLDAAISAYQSLAAQFDKSRQVAATAIFRLGECYRKLGRTNEALAQYDRIVREFSDQQTLAMLSRQNIAGLSTARQSPSATASTGDRAEQRRLLEEEIKLVQKKVDDAEALVKQRLLSPGDETLYTTKRELLSLQRQSAALGDGGSASAFAQPEAASLNEQLREMKKLNRQQLRVFVQQNFSNPVLTKLVQNLTDADQKLVELKLNFTADHPAVKNQQAIIDTLNQRIDEQVDGVMTGLEIKLKAVLRQPPNLGGISTASESGNVPEEANRLAAQLNGIEQLKDNPEEQARASLAFFPDETLKKMLLQLPKLKEQETILRADPQADWKTQQEKLAARLGYSPTANGSSYHTAFGSEGLEPERHGTNLITDAQRELTNQLSWIRERVDFTVGIQKARLQVLQAAVAETPAGETTAGRTSAPLADDEEKEIRRIQAMIQNSPDLITAPSQGETGPLFVAAARGQLRVVQYLLDHGADVNLQINGRTALNSAVLSGNKAMVELLLSRGAEINAAGGGGDTPLHTAVRNGFRAVAETLLDHKADVNARNSNDNGRETPLHITVARGNVALVRLLIAKGADVNAQTWNGRTPLSIACNANSPDTIKALLDAKADPSAGKLDTPLLCAIKNRNVEAAELLLKAGANPNALSDNDWNVGLYERRYSNPGAGKPTSATPLWFAAQQGQLALVKLLLQFKADANDTQTDGNSILFQALQNPEILAALLDAGGKIESRLSGNIPLISVASWGAEPNPAVVELLLKGGANPNATDDNGDTPLHFVMKEGGSRNRQIVELLFAYHADPNTQNKRGETPLDVAKINYNGMKISGAEAADLLRAHGAVSGTELPQRDRITISRPSANYSEMILFKGTNEWNRFTLLEAMAAHYKFIQANLSPPDNSLQFPDFAHVTIHRPAADGKSWKTIPVNVAEIFGSGDCSRNTWLEWGDVVEIPEHDHRIGESWIGFPLDGARVLTNCVFPKITVVVQGERKEFKLQPNWTEYGIGGSNVSVPRGSPSFLLRQFLYSSGLIRFSSDLSRVKVSRQHDPADGKKREWILDCSGDKSPDLWLRDGDVVEVPDK